MNMGKIAIFNIILRLFDKKPQFSDARGPNTTFLMFSEPNIYEKCHRNLRRIFLDTLQIFGTVSHMCL